MPLHLPQPVAAYFTADKSSDGEAVSQCFTKSAVVKDEGHTHTGQAAIKQWKDDVSVKYQYTCEPLACDEKDGKIIITSRLTGNFPGSPVNLQFCFELDGDRIASLEVAP